jgi:hypothetical protein
LSAADASALQKMFGDEGSRFIAIALGQSAVLRERTRAIGEDNKLVDRARVRAEGLNGQLVLAKERFKAVAVQAGEALLPALTELIRVLTPIVQKIGEFVRTHPTATKWVMFAGLVGGALTTLAGLLGIVVHGFKMLAFGGLFGPIIGGIGGIRAAVTGLTASLAANPIVLAILGIAGAVYAAHKLYKGVIGPALFPSTYGRDKPDMYGQALEAQIKLREWTSGQTTVMGEQIGTGFMDTTAGFGTQMGMDHGEALTEAQRTAAEHPDPATRRAAMLSPDYWRPMLESESAVMRMRAEKLKRKWEMLQPRKWSEMTGGVSSAIQFAPAINALLDAIMPKQRPILGDHYVGARLPESAVPKMYEEGQMPLAEGQQPLVPVGPGGGVVKDYSTHQYDIKVVTPDSKLAADETIKQIEEKQRRGPRGRVGHTPTPVPSPMAIPIME